MTTDNYATETYGSDRSDARTTTNRDVRRANPLGAYITTVGALIVLVSVWLPWVTLGRGDEGNNGVSGYEADSIIPFVGFLGLALAVALLYALKRADRRQHRGLSLVSMAVGLAWLLFTIAFLVDPISTRQYRDNVSTEFGLIVSMIGALIWAIGSYLLAKEPEGERETDTAVRSYTSRPVTTQTTATVGQTRSTDFDSSDSGLTDTSSVESTSTDGYRSGDQTGVGGSSTR